jgi:hypothetical protein
MVSGQAPVANDRKNKWRHAWLIVPVLVILAVGGSVYASSSREPSYDVTKAVFYEGHLYANFALDESWGSEWRIGVPVPYDTLWGPPTRAVEFTADDGKTYGDCAGYDKFGGYASWLSEGYKPWLNEPYDELVCRELS